MNQMKEKNQETSIAKGICCILTFHGSIFTKIFQYPDVQVTIQRRSHFMHNFKNKFLV